MKGLLLFFILFFITGCGDIKQMNANMEQSNQTVTQNTNTVQHSSDVIQKNTEEIARSTAHMKTVGTYLPFILIVVLALLLYPLFVLIKLQRKVVQEIRLLIDKLKK